MACKTCKGCGNPFEPTSPMQMVCSLACGSAYSRQHLSRGASAPASRALARRASLERRTPLRGHTLLRTRVPAGRRRTTGTGSDLRQLMRTATRAFNAYIRERDAHLPCVSCGCCHAAEWQAGHYMAVGARSELRFDEANVHRQCADCNTTRAGHHSSYRATLLRRIGPPEVARLEGLTSPRKWTADELRAITRVYTEKLNLLRLRRPEGPRGARLAS